MGAGKHWLALSIGRDVNPERTPGYRVSAPACGESEAEIERALGVKPFKPEVLKAWLDDLRQRGVALRHDGEAFYLWWPGDVPNYTDTARVEANYGRLLALYGKRHKPPEPEGEALTHCASCAGVGEGPRIEAPQSFALAATPAAFHRVDLDLAQPLTSFPLAFADVETTGLDPEDGERVVDAAVCRVEPDGMVRWEVSLFDPEGRQSSPKALEKHKLTPEKLKGAPLFSSFALRFRQILSGAVVVGHNVGFDVRFFQMELERAGYPWGPSATLDSLALARRLYPGQESYALDTLAPALGIPVKESHRARPDVLTTRALWALLAARFPEAPTLGAVSDLQGAFTHRSQSMPLPSTCGDCGSNRGVTRANGPHIQLSCAGCGRYVKFLSKASVVNPKRTPESPAEEWASESLLRLDEEGLFSERDEEIGGSFAEQLRKEKRLSPRQWETAVGICRRYAREVGEAPE